MYWPGRIDVHVRVSCDYMIRPAGRLRTDGRKVYSWKGTIISVLVAQMDIMAVQILLFPGNRVGPIVLCHCGWSGKACAFLRSFQHKFGYFLSQTQLLASRHRSQQSFSEPTRTRLKIEGLQSRLKVLLLWTQIRHRPQLLTPFRWRNRQRGDESCPVNTDLSLRGCDPQETDI